MSTTPPPRVIRLVLRWLGHKVLKNGCKTGRWIAWLLLPAWLFAIALGGLAEWLEHA